MEQNAKVNLEEQKAQELKDLIWFGQGQLLGEIMNADPVKAEAEPKETVRIALKMAISLKTFIDEQVKESNDDTGANEVFISAVQILGRKINSDYHKAINNQNSTILYAYNMAILSIAVIEEELKKEREITEA